MLRNRTKLLLRCATALLVLGAAFLWGTRWLSQPKQPVQIGDTKSDVLATLGHPTAIFTNDFVSLKHGGEVWAYGEKIDVEAALRGDFPFKLRLFAPRDSDVLVVFNASQTVNALQIPSK
jgi:hypothetical protein